MKNYIKYLGCLLMLGCFSCRLDETVYSSIYTDNFYSTAEDAEAALAAVYSELADLYGGPAALLVPDFSADQVYPRPVVGRDVYTLFSYDAAYSVAVSYGRSFESPIDIWNNCYTGIENANWILTKVPNTNMSNTKRKKEILGEAFFLRAYFHWFLTKNFGDIVIRTKASHTLEDAYTEKSSKADVYKQIYLDLDSAIASLPDYSPALIKGRPSKQAAQALYAKAALYGENWTLALAQAKAALNSGTGIGLMDNVLDVYNPAKEDNARKENLWAFEAESVINGRASQITSLYGPRNSNGPAYATTSYGSMFAYQAFYNSFDPKDKRRQLLDTTYIDRQGKLVHQADITPITRQGVLVKKYMDPNSIAGRHATNIQLLRVADIYLVAAEAEARLNGATADAYMYINTVRKRAGLDDLQPGLAQDPFIAAVLQERSWELFAEGDRWYDLTRTNTFLTVIPTAVNDVFPARRPQARNRYFPIPQDEINANNKLEQNPDWK
ncbi:RagB/SusD family nutrient uptake outer membrane protein [Chitinophaga tropicalis]|uniref:RagB/SusD family nutrient uptake outer membrane protein n=1 Tax=Chitinophaga tropicalis TaxID=2683588 RepID=A0A7K1U0P0_9BACT|nr:RagB/SusD family nutrient uptake outer membrane protein [Chitinophaga tropicalis]MVT07929.1 RagB/SusD family nutrient uptake outer membrane protein [Chitinophaga tropicalis]